MDMPKMEQLKPRLQQLEDCLLSFESWGELASPLDRSVEILRALHCLSLSFPAVKVTNSALYQNIARIFENTIRVIDNMVQLNTNADDDSAHEKSKCLRHRLEEFVPELRTAKDECSYAECCDFQSDSSSKRHIAHHLSVITNVLSKTHEILMSFKSVFFVCGRASFCTLKFSKASLKLGQAVSMLESSSLTAAMSENHFLSAFFSALDRPFKIAINALWLLFTFPAIEHAEFETLLMLCKNTVRMFVCATAILNDLTQFFLKDSSIENRVFQCIQALHKCCSEMFPLQVTDATILQSSCNTRETCVNTSQESSKNMHSVPIPQSLCDTKAKCVDTSLESSKNVYCSPIPTIVSDTKGNGVVYSQESFENAHHVPIPTSMCTIEANGVHAPLKPSNNVYCPIFPCVCDPKKNVVTSQESVKNAYHIQESSTNIHCSPIPLPVHNTKENDVIFSQESAKNLNDGQEPSNKVYYGPVLPPVNNTKESGVLTSHESMKSVYHSQASSKIYYGPCLPPVDDTKENGVLTSQGSIKNTYHPPESSKNVYCSSLPPSACDTRVNNVGTAVRTQSVSVPNNLFQDTSAILKEIPAMSAFSHSSCEAKTNTEMEIPTNPSSDALDSRIVCPGMSDAELKSLTPNQRKTLEELIENCKYHVNFLSFSVKIVKSEVQALCKICNKILRVESMEDHINDQQHLRNLFDKCRASQKARAVKSAINHVLNTDSTTCLFVDICDIKLDNVVPNQKKILTRLIKNIKWHVNHFLFAVIPVDTKIQPAESEIQIENSDFQTKEPNLDTAESGIESAKSDSEAVLQVECKICDKTLLAEHTEVHIDDPSHHRSIYEKCKTSSEARKTMPQIQADNWQFLKIVSEAEYKCSLCSVRFGSFTNTWIQHFHSIVHRTNLKERKSQISEHTDLVASAHFFRDSLEENFAYLEISQKHRVGTLIAELKDGLNFFSIMNDPKSTRLSFFCHVCRISVSSKKVPDHVKRRDHVRRLTREGWKVLNESVELSNNSCRNDAKFKKSCLLDVFNEYFKDSCGAVKVKKSVKKPKKHSRKSRSRKRFANRTAKRGDNSCEGIWESQEHPFSSESTKNPCAKVLNIRRRKFASSPQECIKNAYFEDPGSSSSCNELGTEQRKKSSDRKIPVRAERRDTANLQGSNNIRAKVAPYLKPSFSSAPTVQGIVPEVSISSALNKAQSTSQNFAQDTAQNLTSYAQNIAQCTSQKVGQGTALNFASNASPALIPKPINLEQDSFSRIFSSLSPRDKQIVRNIIARIKDKMNCFALSNKAGTKQLRIVCKVCRCPMRPETVESHISNPGHVKKLAQQSSDHNRVTVLGRSRKTWKLT